MMFVRLIDKKMIVLALVLSGAFCSAQEKKVAPANYDESKVPQYTLPDPLKLEDGRKVDSADLWNKQRRPEILRLFEEQVYGKPTLGNPSEGPIKMKTELLESSPVFDGKGMRHQLRLSFYKADSPEDKHQVDFLVYTPKPDSKESGKKYPMFLGLNFQGNHATSTDSGIYVTKTIWARSPKAKPLSQPGKEEDRGVAERRFPYEKIIQGGFAVGTAYYGDIEPDYNGGIRNGVRRFLYENDQKQKPDEANAIATWAWGLGRLLDTVIEHQDKLGIEPSKVAVFGHSRLGKTSLWAGAIDPRFALVISNDSGCGGAALSRREFGETVHRINTAFPHWFCDNFKNYSLDVNSLPIDQHELIALIAPRPVYIASATEDLWADPRGEFLSGLHADPVYRLLGTDGFGGVTEMPEADKSIGDRIGYHIRTGKHDIIEFDWIQYMNFADKHYSAE